MKKKTSPLTLNVKAEGYAMNAQLICEDSQGNKVELTSKGTNRINLGMVRWFINILLLITWAEVFWDSCFGRQFMFQDSNVQSCGKKWCENAWGPEREKAVPFFPPRPSSPDRAHLIGLFRGVPIIWGPGTGYVLETVLHTTGVSLIRCGSLTSSVAVPFSVSPNGCRELNYRLWLLLRTWNFYIRLMLVSFSAFCLSYCRVVESVGEVVSTILGRMKLSRANRSLWALLKQINRIEESFLSLLDF